MITYYITEDNVPGFTATIAGSASGGYIVTNSKGTPPPNLLEDYVILVFDGGKGGTLSGQRIFVVERIQDKY